MSTRCTIREVERERDSVKTPIAANTSTIDTGRAETATSATSYHRERPVGLARGARKCPSAHEFARRRTTHDRSSLMERERGDRDSSAVTMAIGTESPLPWALTHTYTHTVHYSSVSRKRPLGVICATHVCIYHDAIVFF